MSTGTVRTSPARKPTPDHRGAALHRSSVGKKALMAVSGAFLFLFIVLHMVGNLKMLQGPEAMNGYARFIREVGYPVVPHEGLLWVIRILLLASIAVHVASAFQLWQRSRAARPVAYRKPENLSFSYASRTMRWGGVIILAFVVYHILHMTTGQAHPDFVHGDVGRNFIIAFSNPLVLGFYLLAQAALCLHLYHGLWSMTQTLGANHPRYNPIRRPIALGLALVIFVGFIVPPIAVAIGVIS